MLCLCGHRPLVRDKGVTLQRSSLRCALGVPDEPFVRSPRARRPGLRYRADRRQRGLSGTGARIRHYYNEREICDIVWLVASEHLANITNIGLNIDPDPLGELGPHSSAEEPTTSLPVR